MFGSHDLEQKNNHRLEFFCAFCRTLELTFLEDLLIIKPFLLLQPEWKRRTVFCGY